MLYPNILYCQIFVQFVTVNLNFFRSSVCTPSMNIMYCHCYYYLSPYSQSLISKYDVGHYKENDYDSKIKCTVMIYNLFESSLNLCTGQPPTGVMIPETV